MKISDLELMLFHDGELEPERARRVRVARLYELEVSARLSGLERVGELVRDAARERRLDPAHSRRELVRGRLGRRARVATLGAVAVALLLGVAEPRHESPPEASVQIETVDFGSRAGTVFMLEGHGERQTAVVWLADDGEQAKLGTL